MGPYAKFIVAVIGAMLASAQTAIPMSPLWHGIITVLITGATAFGVRQVENAPLPANGARRWPSDEGGQ